MPHTERIESILQIFAMRAAAELERSRAEHALRESEASYRAIFEAAEDAIFVHDWDTGAIVDVNPKACESFGYSHEEMCGISVGQISSGVPPFTEEEAGRRVGEAKLGRTVQFEWHRRNKDGSLHWDEVRLKSAVIGGHRRVLAFTREITERKLAEEALRASEEQYRAIFNASADALILWDSQFRRVDVNPAYERMLGWTREEVIGRGWEFPAFSADHDVNGFFFVENHLVSEGGVRSAHDDFAVGTGFLSHPCCLQCAGYSGGHGGTHHLYKVSRGAAWLDNMLLKLWVLRTKNRQDYQDSLNSGTCSLAICNGILS